MPRPGIPTWFFAIVVVRRGDQFLLIQEKKHGQTWYFPGGRVELGESLVDAATRETEEESGIPVALDGILRIEHTPRADGARVRAVFLAHPASDAPPKSTPDEESLAAAWVGIADLDGLSLRDPEVRTTFQSVLDGAPVHPLSLLTRENIDPNRK